MEMIEVYDRYVIFPTEYFSHRIEPEYAEEYAAVQKMPQHHAVLFDWRYWSEKGQLRLYGDVPPRESKGLPVLYRTQAIYRGWMMKPEVYSKFYKAWQKQGLFLVNNDIAYDQMHEFPNAYPYLSKDTPAIMTFKLGEPVDLSRIKKRFRRFMVKDYVKSVKGSDFPVYFDSATITEDEFQRQMQKFYQYRGNQLTGGICIKEYIDLKKYAGRTNEWRIFYYCDDIVACTPNSGQPRGVPEPSEYIRHKYQWLTMKSTGLSLSNFYVLDCAQRADGHWTILETGDGQVSGLPALLGPGEFYNQIDWIERQMNDGYNENRQGEIYKSFVSKVRPDLKRL